MDKYTFSQVLKYEKNALETLSLVWKTLPDYLCYPRLLHELIVQWKLEYFFKENISINI